jgi:hypothetical protein
VLAFKKLSDALDEPGEMLLSDFSKIERSPLLHIAFQALDAYQVGEGGGVQLPEGWWRGWAMVLWARGGGWEGEIQRGFETQPWGHAAGNG